MGMNVGDVNSGFRTFANTDTAQKAKQVIDEVNAAASQMINVDDKVDIDLNKAKGEVKVKKSNLGQAGGDFYTGSLSYDAATGSKSEMYVDVLKDPKNLKHTLQYDKDYQSIPIFGKKKELYEKTTPDDLFPFKKFIQTVTIDPQSGKIEYSERIHDQMDDINPHPPFPPNPPIPPYPH
ncbi:MAG: hypothetical protein LWY06_00385 [Firmicutes bacterium]|nr:hypothetical protein [Bacillota bacterium]